MQAVPYHRLIIDSLDSMHLGTEHSKNSSLAKNQQLRIDRANISFPSQIFDATMLSVRYSIPFEISWVCIKQIIN
jgi:hypothetical protein